VLRADDEIIVIAEDDTTVRVDLRAPSFDETKLCRSTRVPTPPERTLILGFNRRAVLILQQLDAYVAVGSEALVVADVDQLDDRLGGVELERLELSWRRGDTTSRALLDELALGSFDHVITLSYAEELDVQRADARTLVTLLHLRDIARKTGASFSVVSEILDVKNRELAEVTQADDFIVSDRLVSLVLAQIAEARDRAAVFRDLFDSSGKEVYLRPVSEYLEPGGDVDFYTVLEGARRRGEVALGYRLARHATDPERDYGIRVNPKKSERVSFTDEDRIIVLAED
jgi:ion channel POLLUX/CASTOR